jgi:hypothetical protein
MKLRFSLTLGLLALVFAAVILTGCATTEPENVSSRPWNTPRGWTGLPIGINEGR